MEIHRLKDKKVIGLGWAMELDNFLSLVVLLIGIFHS